jgi:carbonic anhydrase/acetyltransferase-like protein (isoleucine patch superfamily)
LTAEDPSLPGVVGPAIVRSFGQLHPRIHPQAWLAPGSVVVGDVEIGADSSIWYGSVVRGDVERVRIGRGTNLQDGSVVHVTAERFPTLIGDDVTLGHRSVVHGCVVEDGALIGIGAIVLDGAHVGAGALIGAGAVVTPGSKIEARGLALGTPAKVVRTLSDAEFEEQLERTRRYVETARIHARSEALRT